MKFLNNIKNFFNKNKKKRINKFLKKSKKQINKKVFLKEKTSTFTNKRQKKFSNFRVKFNLKDLSLKEYYEKYQKRNETGYYTYYITVSLILILLTIYAFFFSDYFNIKHIIINPKKNITNVDIASRVLDEYRFKSIFFIPKDKIINKLKYYQNNIENIEIKRLFPNTIKININSYDPAFFTQIEKIDYILLENGTLVPSNNQGKLAFLEIYYKDLNSKGILDYKKIFKETFIKKIKYITTIFSSNLFNKKIKKIKYYVLEREVHLVLDNGVILIFSLNNNIKGQLENLILFLNKNNKDYKTKDSITKKIYNIYYMDLRVPKEVIYCTYKTKNNCIKNLKRIYDYEEKKYQINNKKDTKKNIKKIEKKEKEKPKNKFPKIKINGDDIKKDISKIKEEIKEKPKNKFPKIKIID